MTKLIEKQINQSTSGKMSNLMNLACQLLINKRIQRWQKRWRLYAHWSFKREVTVSGRNKASI